MYYLQNRYYDSAIGRFINADSIIPSVSDSVYGTNLFSYGFNNPINLQDDNGAWPKWLKKAVAVVVTAIVVVVATAVTVSTYGALSPVGTAMLSACATYAAKTAEVAVLQINKGKSEGKSDAQIAKDTFEAIYDNGNKIIGVPSVTKSAATFGTEVVLNPIKNLVKGDVTPPQTLNPTNTSMVSYAFAAGAWANYFISAFSEDPVARARVMGYTLK